MDSRAVLPPKRRKQFENATKGKFGEIIAYASVEGGPFLDVMRALSGLVKEEADFVLTPDGLTVREMDPSHIAMVDLQLPKLFFRPL